MFSYKNLKRLWANVMKLSGGRDRGVRISRLLYPYLPPPVPFCPASPASFTGNILYYNRACAFLIAFNYTNKGQFEESWSKADFCQDICVICVFWRYMQIKQYDNVKIIIYYIFLQPFINVVSRFPPPEDSRLPLFPLPPTVTFLPGSRPLSPPPLSDFFSNIC